MQLADATQTGLSANHKRTREPPPLSAELRSGCLEDDRQPDILFLRTMPRYRVDQGEHPLLAVRSACVTDRSRSLSRGSIVPGQRSLPGYGSYRTVAYQLVYVENKAVLDCLLSIIVTMPPTATAAHLFAPRFISPGRIIRHLLVAGYTHPASASAADQAGSLPDTSAAQLQSHIGEFYPLSLR